MHVSNIIAHYLIAFFFFFVILLLILSSFFFFNDTATTEIYTLSLHDALPISIRAGPRCLGIVEHRPQARRHPRGAASRNHQDRKSTRLNSSHGYISYAVFCLKKKKKKSRSTMTCRDHMR